MNLTALQILQQFSLVDFKNYSNITSISGRALIGGNITSSGITDFYTGPNSVSSPFAALTVYGNVSSNARVDDGGDAYVGGSGGATVTYNGGGSLQTTVPESEANIQSTVSGFSGQLAALTANSSYDFNDPNNATLTASPVGGVAVFSLSATALATARTLYLAANGATTIIINVTGTGTANLSGINFTSSVTNAAADIIWNFNTVTAMTVGPWQGTILAPSATLTSTSQINGDVLVNAFQGGGTINSIGYAGVNPVCFVTGTRLLAERGEIAVEQLQPGDRVATVCAGRIAMRPVTWIGRRDIDLSRHPRPRAMAPVRIRRGAFADDVPHRDLLLSQDHAIFVHGKLIAARQLLNGSTIHLVTDLARVTYCHVELGRHDILLAEGLPTESYLDTGNRAFFANATEATALHPELPNDRRETASCAPFVTGEADVRPVWTRLADRAAGFGLAVRHPDVTPEPDLHLMIDDKPIRPISTANGTHQFLLPGAPARVRLRSRAAAPTELRPWLEDRRCLGVYVESITLRSAHEVRDIPLDHPTLASGWWRLERDGDAPRRWTNGDALLLLPPVDGSAVLEIRATASGMDYPLRDGHRQRAA